LPPRETGDVKDFHRRDSGVGVDNAIHRDGGDLGAVDPAVLTGIRQIAEPRVADALFETCATWRKHYGPRFGGVERSGDRYACLP